MDTKIVMVIAAGALIYFLWVRPKVKVNAEVGAVQQGASAINNGLAQANQLWGAISNTFA